MVHIAIISISIGAIAGFLLFQTVGTEIFLERVYNAVFIIGFVLGGWRAMHLDLI